MHALNGRLSMERSCLRCKRHFDSKGFENRLCERCNYENLKVSRIEVLSINTPIVDPDVDENFRQHQKYKVA